ncbi:unnamed protein product [Phaeothamnion confervicola]
MFKNAGFRIWRNSFAARAVSLEMSRDLPNGTLSQGSPPSAFHKKSSGPSKNQAEVKKVTRAIAKAPSSLGFPAPKRAPSFFSLRFSPSSTNMSRGLKIAGLVAAFLACMAPSAIAKGCGGVVPADSGYDHALYDETCTPDSESCVNMCRLCIKKCKGEEGCVPCSYYHLSETVSAAGVSGEWVLGLVSHKLATESGDSFSTATCTVYEVAPANSCNITIASASMEAAVFSPTCLTKGACMGEGKKLPRSMLISVEGSEDVLPFIVLAATSEYMMVAWGDLAHIAVYVKDTATMPLEKINKRIKKYTNTLTGAYTAVTAEHCAADAEYAPEGFCEARRNLVSIFG